MIKEFIRQKWAAVTEYMAPDHTYSVVKENGELVASVYENKEAADLIAEAPNLKRECEQLREDKRELVEALDAVTRVFIYCSKSEFTFEDKVKATEMAVATLIKNGISTIGQTLLNTQP